MIQLEPRFQVQYSRAAATWQAFNLFWHRTEVFGRAVKDGKLQRGIATLFWGAQLRFFRSMLMAAKVPALAVEARAAIEADCAVVIGLQSTGEANQRAEVEANGVPQPMHTQSSCVPLMCLELPGRECTCGFVGEGSDDVMLLRL